MFELGLPLRSCQLGVVDDEGDVKLSAHRRDDALADVVALPIFPAMSVRPFDACPLAAKGLFLIPEIPIRTRGTTM